MDFLIYEKIEAWLSNFSFIFLFFSMIFYWIYLSGNLIPKSNSQTKTNLQMESPLPKSSSETVLFGEVTVFETQSENLNLSSSYSKNINFEQSDNFLKFGQFFIVLANLSLLFFLSLRWIHSGHFPLSNLYESLLFLCWSLTFCHLILNYLTKSDFLWIGSITSPTALLINGFANFSLPTDMQRSTALVPALQSNWLMMHVTVMILSYAALIFGCLLSIGFLILTYSISNEDYEKQAKNQDTNSLSFAISDIRFKWAQNLDNLSYRFLGFGFPLLTIGILSGAVWANEAWGSYWSWDPKETWALLTWLIFAIYLHTRITKNWQGKKPAFLAAIGFFVVWICYLGVNLLGEGLHSYGWLVTS